MTKMVSFSLHFQESSRENITFTQTVEAIGLIRVIFFLFSVGTKEISQPCNSTVFEDAL